MTKKKTGSFNGAWMSRQITGSKPIPHWVSAEKRAEIERDARKAEDAARLDMVGYLDNERVTAGQFDSIADARKDGASYKVLEVVLRQLEVWRFDQQRRDAEPEPAEWAGLISKINVPDRPGLLDVLEIDRGIGRLPLHVRAVLDTALFNAIGVGRVGLMERMRQNPGPEDASLLRETLAEMAAAANQLKGKRGTKRDVGPHLRAVCAALQTHCDFSLPAARPVAAELLRLAGIPAPTSRSRLTELAPK